MTDPATIAARAAEWAADAEATQEARETATRAEQARRAAEWPPERIRQVMASVRHEEGTSR